MDADGVLALGNLFETPLAEMKRESMPLAEVADRTKKIIGELKNNT